MLSPFDVPGTVVLRDVSRPALGETPADRLRRLAGKAVVEGCLATCHDAAEMVYAVTSGSRSGVTYAVDAAAGTCTCKATRPCKHFALVALNLLTERDRLRGLDARDRLKTTRDLHNLQNVERRAARLAPVIVSPVSETPATQDPWAADLAERVLADAVPARYPGVCAIFGQAFGRGARIVKVGDGHGANRWALADVVIAGHLGSVAA